MIVLLARKTKGSDNRPSTQAALNFSPCQSIRKDDNEH